MPIEPKLTINEDARVVLVGVPRGVRVVRYVDRGEPPPELAAQPPEPELSKLAAWIEAKSIVETDIPTAAAAALGIHPRGRQYDRPLQMRIAENLKQLGFRNTGRRRNNATIYWRPSRALQIAYPTREEVAAAFSAVAWEDDGTSLPAALELLARRVLGLQGEGDATAAYVERCLASLKAAGYRNMQTLQSEFRNILANEKHRIS